MHRKYLPFAGEDGDKASRGPYIMAQYVALGSHLACRNAGQKPEDQRYLEIVSERHTSAGNALFSNFQQPTTPSRNHSKPTPRFRNKNAQQMLQKCATNLIHTFGNHLGIFERMKKGSAKIV